MVVYGVNAALAIPTGLKAIQVATGNGYCLAVKSDSTVVVWGTGAGSAVPATLGKVKNVFASHDLASAITVNGEMVSWGNMGLPSPQVAKPNDTTGVRMVAPGMFHTLFLRANGALGGWGYNGASQAAIPAGAPTDGVAIAVGYRYSVVLRANGLVYAWGERNYNASVTPPAITSP